MKCTRYTMKIKTKIFHHFFEGFIETKTRNIISFLTVRLIFPDRTNISCGFTLTVVDAGIFWKSLPLFAGETALFKNAAICRRGASCFCFKCLGFKTNFSGVLRGGSCSAGFFQLYCRVLFKKKLCSRSVWSADVWVNQNKFRVC